jgi:GT2 family glycosyltransferase/pyruvate-formate lyase-activating enzyme
MVHKLDFLRRCGDWRGKILVGGPHTSVALNTIPDLVDFVVQGEGERAILDIVEEKVNSRVVSYPRIKPLDDLPMPAWDYFIHLPYDWGLDWFKEKPVFTMNTSRGCPFHCTFCSVGSIWGRNYTFFSAERIISEIEFLAEHYGAKGIYFREDNFTCNRERLNRFCRLMTERRIGIPWACETRADALDRETVAFMHQAGARAFYIGVESGSQRMLDYFKKGITLEQIRNAFTYCREFGIQTGASILIGAPTETEEDLKRTFALIEEIQPTVMWPNVFVGIPDSGLYQYAILNKLHEFIDDRGLVYLKGHNDRVKRFYGNRWNAIIPANLNQPKISVVMATYNDGLYLQMAVESILKQTFQDFELIIVDDGSTDATPDILSKVEDPRVRVFRNSQNLGLTKSLNIGVRHARGRYIARMDADDISLPHRLETQVNFLEKNREYGLIGSSYYKMDETGEIHSLIHVLEDDRSLQAGLKKQNWFGHGSVMMRKDAFQQVGGYDERFRFAQDYDLWLRMAKFYKVANSGEPLYCWRFTESSISKTRAEEQKYFANLALFEAEKRDKEEISFQTTGPMVSIVVPTHNRPEMLVEAVQSILNQTYPHVEIVVVNDAGVNVESVLSSLNKKGNIVYVKHDRNRGLAAARNTGIRLARGKYIAYLDDDDLYYPNHLEALVHFLEGSDHKVAYTDAYRAHQQKENGVYVVVKRDVPYSFDFDYDRILVDNFVPVLCFMHEKTCLDEVGCFDEELTTQEDWDLWIRLSRKFKIAHIPKITCEFSWREDGTTMTSEKQMDFLRNRKRIYEKYTEYLKDKPELSHVREAFLKNLDEWVKREYDRIQQLIEKNLVEEAKYFYRKILDLEPENEAARRGLDICCNQSSSFKLSKRTEGSVRDAVVPENNQKLVSIIILAHNQVEYTRECLNSIFRHTDEPFELIVVDNASTDGTSDYLKQVQEGRVEVGGRRVIPSGDVKIIQRQADKKKKKGKKKSTENLHACKRFKVIRNERNLGFAAGNNQGMAEARGDYLLLMNNDVVATPKWLSRMMAVAERKPEIGIVGPMSNYVSGPQWVKKVTYDPQSLAGLNPFAQDYAQKHQGQSKPFWRVVGFCMLIKRVVTDIIGGLDERYGLGNFEDDDFSLRASLAGFESWIAEDCFVHHFGSRTFDGARIDYRESLNKNWEIFKKKWGISLGVSYGAPFDLAQIMREGFNPVKHYYPLSPDKHSMSRGEELFQLGDMEGAKGIFNRILKENPDHVDVFNNLGVIAYQEGDIDQAIAYLEKGLNLQPDHPELLENLGRCLFMNKEDSEARRYFEQAKAVKPGDLSLLNSFGHCLIQAGDFSRAEEIYRESYQLDQTQANIKEILAGLEELKVMVDERRVAL